MFAKPMQFVDPLIVMRECNRRVSFLIAAKSMQQWAIGFLASFFHPSKYILHDTEQ